MRQFWPELATIDIHTSTLRDLVSLRAARKRLEVTEAEVRADDQVQSKVARVNHFGEEEFFFRPRVLPNRGSLPTLEDMCDPSSKKPRKAQRNFLRLVHRSNWVALKKEIDALPSEDFREKIRFMSVSQQFARTRFSTPSRRQTTPPSPPICF